MYDQKELLITKDFMTIIFGVPIHNEQISKK